MSIKRSKSVSYGSRDRNGGQFVSFNKAQEPEPEPVWADIMVDKPEEAFIPYSMDSTFSKGSLISHKKFGKGVVVAVDGQRIDVLFETEKKKLSHKP